jgi:hypothetical protein
LSREWGVSPVDGGAKQVWAEVSLLSRPGPEQRDGSDDHVG